MISKNKFNGNTIRIILIFACACLIMTGYFISSATAGRADDITLVKGGTDDTSLYNGPPEAGDGTGVGTSGGINDASTGGGVSAAGFSEGAAELDNAGSDTAYPDGGAQDDIYTGGGNVMPDGTQAVRDGYFIPGGAGAAPISDRDRIYVYVTGAVQKPGVYELARSSMVVDAVEIAGGFTDQADAENINMVYRLESNAMVNIKKKPLAPSGNSSGAAGANAGMSDYPDTGAGVSASGDDDQNSSELYGSAVEISYDYSGVLATGDNAAEGAEGDVVRRININTATAEQLATLPGIGKATADSIIAYRGKQKFNRIEDLMKVSGIKQAKFDAVKDLISC